MHTRAALYGPGSGRIEMLKLKHYQLALCIAVTFGCFNAGVTALARVSPQGYRRPNATRFTPAQSHQAAPLRPVSFNQTWSAPPQPSWLNYTRQGRQNQTLQQHPTWTGQNQTWRQGGYQTTPQPIGYGGGFNSWTPRSNSSRPGGPFTNNNWGNGGSWHQPNTSGGAFNSWNRSNNSFANNWGGAQYQTTPQPIAGGGFNNWRPQNNFSAPSYQNGGGFSSWGAQNNFSASGRPAGGAQYNTTPQPQAPGFNNYGASNNFSAAGPVPGNNWYHAGSKPAQIPNDWQGQGQQSPGGGAVPLAPLGNAGWQQPSGPQNPFLPAGPQATGGGIPLAPLGQNAGSQAGLSYAQGNPNSQTPSGPNSSNPYANLFN